MTDRHQPIAVRVLNTSPYASPREYVDLVVPWRYGTGPDMKPRAALFRSKRGDSLCWLGDRVGANARMAHLHSIEIGALQELDGTIEIPEDSPQPDAQFPHDHAAAIAVAFGEVPNLDTTEPQVINNSPLPGYSIDHHRPVQPTHWQVLELNAGRTVLKAWGRAHGLYQCWYIYLRPGSRVLEIESYVCFSDRETPAFTLAFQEGLSIVDMSERMFPHVDYLKARGGGDPFVDTFRRTRVPVLPPEAELERNWLGDGQALAWRGAMLLHAGATPDELETLNARVFGNVWGMARAHEWKDMFGPWRHVPVMHPNHEGGVAHEEAIAAAIDFNGELLRRGMRDESIWRQARHGNLPVPSSTGDQEDFGTAKALPALHGDTPACFDEMWFSMLHEGFTRPTHYRLPNGDRLTQEAEPDAAFWGGRIHFHPGISKYRHGKPEWTQWRPNGPVGPFPSGYMWGHRNSHWSINNLGALTQLTGSWMLYDALTDHAEAYLLDRKTSGVLGGHGEARSGRAELAAAWCYVVGSADLFRAPDDRLKDRWREKLTSTYKAHFERVADKKPVQVLQVTDWFPNKRKGWAPWQEALGLTGLLAIAEVVPEYKDLCHGIGRTLVMQGFRITKAGDWQLGYAIHFIDEDTPLTHEQLDDENFAKWGGIDTAWGISVLPALKRIAHARDDMAMEDRCSEILEYFDTRWRSSPPRGGIFDKHREWVGTR